MSPKICIASLAIIAGLLFKLNKQVLAAEDKQCGINVSELKTKCLRYVNKPGPPEQPSQACCEILDKIDVQCACVLATEDGIRAMQNMNIRIEKAIFVAESCGVVFSPGTKCGNYTMPSE